MSLTILRSPCAKRRPADQTHNEFTDERSNNGRSAQPFKRPGETSSAAHLTRLAPDRANVRHAIRAGLLGRWHIELLDALRVWPATVLRVDFGLVAGGEPCDLEGTAARLPGIGRFPRRHIVAR